MFVPKSLPKSMKMKLKGGGFVDPDSNLEHKVRTYSNISLFKLVHPEYPYRSRIKSAWHQLNPLICTDFNNKPLKSNKFYCYRHMC